MLGLSYENISMRKQADDLGIKIWQTPSFLFLLLGIIIISVMAAVYYISLYYNSPEVLIISETIVVITLFVIGTLIIQNIEYMEKANKMKSEFVSIASHQLKVPVSQINWNAEMIMSKKNKKASSKNKDYLERIYRSSKYMNMLVNDLLDVSRIELGTLAIEPEKIKVSKITKLIISEFEKRIREKKIKVIEKYESSEPYIQLDPKIMRLVLQNILSNAVKYTPDGGNIKIEIKSGYPDILVKISDSGLGIPEKEQKKVFSKLFRASNVEKEADGTGLGLYIVKEVVDQTGGRIWFDSKEKKGTTFYIAIPQKGMQRKSGTKGLENTGIEI